MKKLIFVILLSLIVFSLGTKAHARSRADIVIKEDGVVCFESDQSCEFIVGLFNSDGGLTDYTPIYWNHKLDSNDLSGWVTDDDYYHVLIPYNQAVGEHTVFVAAAVQGGYDWEVFNFEIHSEDL